MKMAFGGSINTNVLQDDTFDLLCTMCEQKVRNREAEKYCVECGDYYCLSCAQVHDEVPSLKRHKILDKGKFPSRSITARSRSGKTQPMAPTERCDRHSHHYIDMYCQNHDDVGCDTCMAVDHRSCQDIFYIPEFLQNNTRISPAKTTLKKLESIATTLKAHYEKFQRGKQKLVKRRASTLGDILKFRKEINERLDELEKNTVTDTEVRYKALISKLEEEMEILEINRANIQSARDKLVSVDNNVSQNFVNDTKGKNIAIKAEECIEVSKSQLPTEDIDFRPDLRISALLQELPALGNVKQRETIKIEQATTVKQQVSGQKNENSNFYNVNNTEQEALLKVKGNMTYHVEVRSDTFVCNIVSACTLEDGTILLSDFRNYKLKRLDSSSYTVIDYCDLPVRPWQVCSINKYQAAVCLPNQLEVHFISLSNRMTLTNKITTDFYCSGLAYANDNLYISDLHTSVYIYSVSGRKLKQFSKDQSGKELFSDISSLAVSEDGSRIYVADSYDGLIILDNNGKVVGLFDGPQLDYAYCSYLTGSGSLFVCGRNSNNVLQFGLDGKLIGEVVKFDDDARYQAICCNQQTSRMVLGRSENEIRVYDII
ncbi:uncharacterized protein LOC123561306 [Mercenaria mercenaria]|uniref:uncharacterized protein LOC123561306 n=1 Tax=Mercenaria mercenaria TaxID=6596 RepID=UPI00234E4B46|nr:uncharacterized protein LOC123561306 [Mercenaria mercenaria]